MDQVFDLWPSSAALARDLNESENTVRAWKRRKNIPSDRDVRLVKAANRRGRDLTFEHLALIRSGAHDVVIPRADCNGGAGEAA